VRTNWWKAALPLILWLVIVLIPPPAGLKSNAWYYFALFFAIIVGLVLEPIPNAALGLIGVTVAVVMGYVFAKPGDSLRWGLSGFSNNTVWLIFGAFMLSLGYEKTGLGRRIALLLVRALGGKTLGLGYAIALADLAIAPGTPSNTARSAGTIFPIIRNIPPLFGSEPGPTSRKIGAYLMWTAFTATAVTSSMFITSMAANPLALSLIKQGTKIDITWGSWFIGFLPIAVVLLIFAPLLVYIIYPPEVKTSKEVPIWARGELSKMGPLKLQEIVMAALVILAIALWIFGGRLVDATTVVMVIISIMVLLKILDWNDILSHKQA
jgi:L-tartrate/succinate antiporter